MTDLLAEYEGYNCHDWDGYGAEPVTPETLAVARTIAAMMQHPPDPAPGGDGTVCFEWRDNKENIICLDVLAGQIAFYGRLDGKFFSARSPLPRVTTTPKAGDRADG